MQHDAAYKNLFSHRRMVKDLLRGFIARKWCDKLDLSSLEKLSAEYVTDDLRQRRGDRLWRVRFRGSSRHLLMMLEFQSTIDAWMAMRMQVYTGLLYLDPGLREKLKESDGKFPPVLPVVLYNGREPWTGALNTVEMIAPAPVEGVLEYQPSQRFILIDMGRYVDEDLPTRNLMSALIAVDKSNSPTVLDAALEALIDWLQEPHGSTLTRAFYVWVRQVVAYRFPEAKAELSRISELAEVRTMLAERMKEWTEEWFEQGIERGRAEGQAEERALLRRLAVRKFDADTAERLSGLLDGVTDPERLTEIGEWIIECETGAELLDRAGNTSRAP